MRQPWILLPDSFAADGGNINGDGGKFVADGGHIAGAAGKQKQRHAPGRFPPPVSVSKQHKKALPHLRKGHPVEKSGIPYNPL